ncbi:MAG: fused MFS/spermidine synthase [Deltaproteobacteria bacterium]|nr:MAG: fused MFS/spermidine synthase [Deltaproteobacteria bacterium]
MRRRPAVIVCLLGSGFAALAYQIVWVRLLGLSFGTDQAAIATVLAVFFGGMAAGNALAARNMHRIRRPLRWVAGLELGIGAFAVASLPALRELHAVYGWLGAQSGPGALAAIRFAAATVVLIPPTVAMGATLPLLARGVLDEDATRGRWSGILYAANTAGAVCGAYLCGFWLIPGIGLTRTVLAGVAANLAVAATLFAIGGGLRVAGRELDEAQPRGNPALRGRRAAFLLCFGVSGFVAIGYEVVWAKIFGIVMEGTLYGFSAVLASFLFGIAVGSFAMAPWVDRVRDLPRAFALLHVGIAVSVVVGMLAVPYLPYAHRRIADAMHAAGGLHLLFALVVPIVLLPTALFGAAFPVLIRIYTRRARSVGAGIGVATAANTAGSIAASLLVGFFAIPALGMDATLYALVLLDVGIALLVLLRLRDAGGFAPVSSAAAAAAMLALALSFPGVHVERAVAGRSVQATTVEGYRGELDRIARSLSLLIEGRSAIVTVAESERGRDLRTNGLPEAGVQFAPPYYSVETVLLGALPYLMSRTPERALVVGLGGGNTVKTLSYTKIRQMDVVELEAGVVEAVGRLHRGRANPLADPRVALRIGDGRNDLLLRRYRGAPRYDIIASQPSHPWRSGAANLFTEEFFALVRDNLAPGGVAAVWINGFRTDPEALLAIVASFEAALPGGLLFDASMDLDREALLLFGSDRPLRLDTARVADRLSEPRLRELLALFGIRSVADLLARSEGPAAAFAALSNGIANSDDNAFVETRIPALPRRAALDFREIESRLLANTPTLPPVDGPLDVEAVAHALLAQPAPGRNWPLAAKLERLLRAHGYALDEFQQELLRARGLLARRATEQAAMQALERLRERHPERPEPLRALGLHQAGVQRRFERAARTFAAAYVRSGDPRDAYDAGRALYHVDPAAAWRWFERIPDAQRADFPRLAFYSAERRLRAGARGVAIRDAYAALRDYRESSDGRAFAGVDELLARVADAAGDPQGARAYRDAARAERGPRGEAQLARAEAEYAAGRLDAALRALRGAEPLLPADPRVARLRAELALARGDRQELAEALGALRAWSPSLLDAVAAENRFRAEHGLPLLPERSADDLARRPL